MHLFNLSLVEFLGLLGAVSSVAVLLYLLDRSRRKQVVATLRFWIASEMPNKRQHRKRIQQPWSLILQLIGMALLLLAVAQLKIGSAEDQSRDHVLLVDGSAWMGARDGQSRRLIETARASALRYVRMLPSTDRVMVVRVDALITPLTRFETNRETIARALAGIQPGASALDLAAAMQFAEHAQQMEGRRRGEIVYAGAGRMSRASMTEITRLPANLRLLPVAGRVENCGLRRLTLRRSDNDPEVWEVYVRARNDGSRPRTMPLVVSYGGAPVGTARLTAGAGDEVGAAFSFRTKASGWLEARLQVQDALDADNVATLEVPAEKSLRVAVYTAEPGLLKPLMGANPRVVAAFYQPAEYRADAEADLVVFDRFAPPGPVARNSVWFEPPREKSPVPVRTVVENVQVHWRPDQFLARGLRARGVRIEHSEVFAGEAGDMAIGEVDGGPVIVARPGKLKTVVFGFHPLRSGLRFELATPLVFANVLRWMAPETFLRMELEAGTTGSVNVPIESDYDATSVKVTSDEGGELPFTIRDGTLRFFSGVTGTVRAFLGERELVYSLTLPDVAEGTWQAPKSVRTGFAGAGGPETAARDVWTWLALAGALVLAFEWVLYGRRIGAVLRFPVRRVSAKRKAS